MHEGLQARENHQVQVLQQPDPETARHSLCVRRESDQLDCGAPSQLRRTSGARGIHAASRQSAMRIGAGSSSVDGPAVVGRPCTVAAAVARGGEAGAPEARHLHQGHLCSADHRDAVHDARQHHPHPTAESHICHPHLRGAALSIQQKMLDSYGMKQLLAESKRAEEHNPKCSRP